MLGEWQKAHADCDWLKTLGDHPFKAFTPVAACRPLSILSGLTKAEAKHWCEVNLQTGAGLCCAEILVIRQQIRLALQLQAAY